MSIYNYSKINWKDAANYMSSLLSDKQRYYPSWQNQQKNNQQGQPTNNVFNEYWNSLNGSPLSIMSNTEWLQNNEEIKSPWYAKFSPINDKYDWNQYPGLEMTNDIYKSNREVTDLNPEYYKTGKRYYYRDLNGVPHYVPYNEAVGQYYNPEGEESTWKNIRFTDYELLPPENINGSPALTNEQKTGGTTVNKDNKKNWFKSLNWKGLGQGLQRIAPNILEDVRLAGNLYNNERVYKTMLEGIRPNLMQTYQTHRQVVGDEATKQAYYRRGAEGVTRASQAFTSDADRQMAYQMEAQRQANELRAQGDLADNQEIRRTSDESNQHQWANTQRRTEVANQNTAQINAANQAKQNLLAQKHSANWSSWENYLYGRESRWRQKQQENKAIADQIWQLDRLGKIQDDPRLLAIQDKLEAAYKKPENQQGEGALKTINYNSEEIRRLLREKRMIELQIQKETLELQQARNGSYFAKSGTKLTYKKKDDLLYKTTKDIVDHFRYMTKMTDDSYQRSRKKVPKLIPHPKSTKKYQQGGVAPFTVFRPVALGGEQSMTTQTTGSSSKASSTKDDSGKDQLNLVKDLFSKMSGLPVDVSAVYAPLMSLMQRVQAGGPELSTQEISTIYIKSMLQMSQLQYNQKAYEEAQKQATANGSLEDLVITNGGKILVQDTSDGSLKPMSWDEYKKSDGEYRLLTNGALLELRAHSPNLAFNSDVLRYVSGTVGISKVTEEIKKLAANIGTTELERQGFSKKEAGQIIKGLEELNDAPAGIYKRTQTTKDQKDQMKAALKYILQILPLNMQNTLKVYADMNGVSPAEIIANGLAAQEDVTEKVSWQPLTGKAATDANGNSKEGSEGLKLNAATALVSGKGYQTEVELNPGTSYSVIANGRFTEFQKHSGENMGAGITMSEASTSTLKGVLDWNKATIGGSRINSMGYNQVILNNGEVVGVDLPIDPSNPDMPDFNRLQQLQELDKQIRLHNIEDTDENWQKVNQLCDELNITRKYKGPGVLNDISWRRFAAFQVVTPDTALVNKNVILDMVGVADEEERELYNKSMQKIYKDKKFELSDKFLFFGHRDELYKGTVFVPIKENMTAAAVSSGQQIYMEDATDLEMRESGYDQNKINSYKKPDKGL